MRLVLATNLRNLVYFGQQPSTHFLEAVLEKTNTKKKQKKKNTRHLASYPGRLGTRLHDTLLISASLKPYKTSWTIPCFQSSTITVVASSTNSTEESGALHYNFSVLFILVAMVESWEQGRGEYAWKHCALVGE